MALHQVGPPDGGEQLGGADDTPGTGPVLPCPVPLVESKPKPAQRGTHAASTEKKGGVAYKCGLRLVIRPAVLIQIRMNELPVL